MIWAINIQPSNFKDEKDFKFIDKIIHEIITEFKKLDFDIVRCVFQLSNNDSLVIYAHHNNKKMSVYIELWGKIISQNEEDGDFEMSISTFLSNKEIFSTKFVSDIESIQIRLEALNREYIKRNFKKK